MQVCCKEPPKDLQADRETREMSSQLSPRLDSHLKSEPPYRRLLKCSKEGKQGSFLVHVLVHGVKFEVAENGLGL